MRKAPVKKIRPKQKPTDLKRLLFTRFMLIVAAFILWIGGISVRLVHLQVNQHEFLLAKARRQGSTDQKTKQLRGTIYDRNLAVLAMSVEVKTLFVDPTEIHDVSQAARDIAKAAHVDAKQLTAKLTEAKSLNKSYVPVAKKVDKENFDRINKALLTADVKKQDEPRYVGVHWDVDQTRSYPYGSLAAPTIGISNDEDQGVAGIEQSQNKLLEGEMIDRLLKRDGRGQVYDEKTTAPEDPENVVLTIDKSIQIVTEQALAEGVANAQARAGMALVMDPTNGEILSLANYPTFDPTNIRSGDTSNHLVQSVYSPGSVFKLMTYGAALEKKLFKPTDMIDAGNGTIEIAGHKFTDSHHVGRVTYAEALAHSSNVCAIKTGMRVGKADFYSMVQKMGFGRKTGVELPAETSGIVRNPDKWNGDSLASMSIGYEIGVTPLQLAAAFATIANDGIRNQPHIIKEIRSSEGKTISINEPNQTQVVSAETAEDLRVMLRQVVLSGTGRRAQLDGYTSAGKTGTAWKFDAKTKRVERSKYMSTFVGFAPAEKPRFVIVVVMDEPQTGARDGGTVSAPVFKDIAQKLLTTMDVPRDLTASSSPNAAEDLPEVNSGESPTVKGPPEEKERTADGPGGTRTQTKPVAPLKKSNQKPILGKTTAVVVDRNELENVLKIWRTNPKT